MTAPTDPNRGDRAEPAREPGTNPVAELRRVVREQQREIKRALREQQQELRQTAREQQRILEERVREAALAAAREQVERRLGDAGTAGGRERIVEHARRLFLERGYADVSMQQIAEAAGLRKASIYHHFKDKTALFNEVVVAEMRRLRSDLEAIAGARAEDDLRTTMQALATAYLGQFRPDTMRLVQDYRQHIPESQHDEMHAELIGFTAIFERLFERARAAGQAIDVPDRIAGAFFFEMMIATVFRFPGEPDPEFEPGEAAALVTHALLDGILRR